MELIDGRRVADEILENVAAQILQLKNEGTALKLAVVLVGDDEASEVYVGQKSKACKRTGIEEEMIRLESDEVTTESLIKLVEDLNNRDDITGFIVQLPLPKHVYTPDVIKAIDPSKDVDGFHAYNIGKLTLSSEFEHLVPCTPKGIIKMLDYYKIDVKGRDVCIVGASNIVGKPMAAMFLNRMATVSICHIETKDLAHYTKYADIVVVAVGKPNLITAEMVKDDVILIDVGINKMEDGRLSGDADFENISKKSSYITPVPGGVGPMTVACLIENTLIAYKRQNNIAI